jgi:hypothetical protein
LFAGGIKTNSTILIEQLGNEKQTVPHLWNSSKMKNKQYHTYGTALKYNRKIIEREAKSPNTHIPGSVKALQ